MTHVAYDPNRPWLGGNTKGTHWGTYMPLLWDWIIDRFDPRDMVDVGCGEGELMLYFFKKGIIVYGVEGLEENKDNCPGEIRDSVYIHDYTLGECPPINVDVVISCEFVEHVEEKYIKNYLPQFLACNYLIFTHAVPNQCGHHHVHCQAEEYWIDLMVSNGLVLMQEETNIARSVNEGRLGFWKTILIFENKNYAE